MTKEFHTVNYFPSWHQGCTRRPRTPQRLGTKTIHKKPEGLIAQNSNPVVPELGSKEISNEESEGNHLHRVPEYDIFSREWCHGGCNSYGFFPNSDAEMAEMAEFAADVESLLGKGFDDEESFGMESVFGLVDCKEESNSMKASLGGTRVKVEEELGDVNFFMADTEIGTNREPFELKYNYEEEENYKVGFGGIIMEESGEGKIEEVTNNNNKKKLLRLDYEAVITAWANQRSPWTSDDWPELDGTECWPDYMGSCGTIRHPCGDVGVMGRNIAMGDGGREARVSRYREKRQTRFFSKKIRYEVRKLNAEKKPRMKGRFVKKANLASTTFPLRKQMNS